MNLLKILVEGTISGHSEFPEIQTTTDPQLPGDSEMVVNGDFVVVVKGNARNFGLRTDGRS